VEGVIGLGLCDGATALALSGSQLSGLVLINPWFVEAKAGHPPAAAVKRYYWRQVSSLAGWKKVVGGSISYRQLFGGLGKIARASPSRLAAEVAAALKRAPPTVLILARDDATAIAAEAEWNGPRFAEVRSDPIYVGTDSHTFARPGDAAALADACLEAIERLAAD
jgi:hypothetical protein